MRRLVKKIFGFIGKHIYIRKRQPEVIGVKETLEYIIENRPSVSRFGDGEIKNAIGKKQKNFNEHQDSLKKKRLQEVLGSDIPGHIVCVQNCFNNTMLDRSSGYRQFWYEHMGIYRMFWLHYMKKGKTYYSTEISRCYQSYLDKSNAIRDFALWKKVWDKRNVLIVEGTRTGVGVNNDLLNNANRVRRILVPAENAFDVYENIVEAVKQHAEKDELILIAAGSTATILAYDLAKLGYQAIDLGHVDIEYEWFKMRARGRVPVPGKYVNEAEEYGGTDVPDIDEKLYGESVIARVML